MLDLQACPRRSLKGRSSCHRWPSTLLCGVGYRRGVGFDATFIPGRSNLGPIVNEALGSSTNNAASGFLGEPVLRACRHYTRASAVQVYAAHVVSNLVQIGFMAMLHPGDWPKISCRILATYL